MGCAESKPAPKKEAPKASPSAQKKEAPATKEVKKEAPAAAAPVEKPKEAEKKADGARTLLVIKCSINGDNSQSNKLVDTFVEKWTAKNADGKAVTRDLDASPLDHLEQPEMAAWMAAEDARTDEQKKLAAVSDEIIAEYKAADEVVIGMPMYNFWVPSSMKAWIDRMLRAGVTFKYTATGVEALIEGKKVYILCARGGVYTEEQDSMTPYLKQTFGFIGQTDLTFIYAEGIAMGPEKAAAAVKEATAKICAVFGEAPPAEETTEKAAEEVAVAAEATKDEPVAEEPVPEPAAAEAPAEAEPATSEKKLLVLRCSINGEKGNSNVLVDSFLDSWKAKYGDAVTLRDLDQTPLPHLEQPEMAAWMTPAEERTEEQQKLAAISDELIEEYKAATEVAIGVPMYNFWIPSTLKAWIDRMLRAGVTFKYTATGVEALLEGKKVYLLCARGGVYTEENDQQTPYLKQTLGFIGQTDLHFVYAEGFAMGEEGAQKASEAGKAKIAELLA